MLLEKKPAGFSYCSVNIIPNLSFHNRCGCSKVHNTLLQAFHPYLQASKYFTMETVLKSGTITPGIEKLYSLDLVEKMCRGSKELLTEMLQVFVDELPRAVKEMTDAFDVFDFATIKKVAHRVKPVLKFYSINVLEEDMVNIEQLAENGFASAELELKIKKMETVIMSIVKDMKESVLI